MILRGAAYLADENIHPQVVAYLRAEGSDVLDVKEGGMSGASDLALIRHAFADQRIVLTHDSDFGRLAVAAGEPMVGIVYLRPGHIRSDHTIGTLRALFDRGIDPSPPFIVVVERSGGRVKIRVRQP